MVSPQSNFMRAARKAEKRVAEREKLAGNEGAGGTVPACSDSAVGHPPHPDKKGVSHSSAGAQPWFGVRVR